MAAAATLGPRPHFVLASPANRDHGTKPVTTQDVSRQDVYMLATAAHRPGGPSLLTAGPIANEAVGAVRFEAYILGDAMTDTNVANKVTSGLSPYLPRLVRDWAATTPDTRFRELTGSLVSVDLAAHPEGPTKTRAPRIARLARPRREPGEVDRDERSGFTALSERLAAKGRAGSEELILVIS